MPCSTKCRVDALTGPAYLVCGGGALRARRFSLLYSTHMKIVIATPLYPPEVGGPAQYALNLEKAFTALGHQAVVVRSGILQKFPTGIRDMLYAWKLLFRVVGADAIIGLDTYSVGLPAALVGRLTRVPLLIRIGGDFLWERYVERTGSLTPIPDFYSKNIIWNRKENIIFRQTKWILSRSVAAFNTEWLRDIWREAYGLDPSRTHVVHNEIHPYEGGETSSRKNYLFYSRQIALKNNVAFRRVLESEKRAHPEIELEEGMVPHGELLKRMRGCYALVVPSVSDVAPNYVLDGLRYGKPFLLTKYSGYAQRFGQYGILIDPLDEADMARGITELATPAVYERLTGNIQNFQEKHTYEDIAREFLALLGR